MDKLTIRLGAADAAALVTIANAIRTDRRPFVTRSAALKFALEAVAADPVRFVAEAGRKADPR